jgi:hypothetical protein
MTATATQLGLSAEGRFARLSHGVRALRSRASFGRLDIWMLVIGGVLMPVGVVLIILGWIGASRTPLPFEQTPYLISGGLLGLGLVMAGGFTYFGYWQTVRIRESREQAKDLADALGRLERLLASGATLGAGAGGRSAAGASFVATPNGSIFHRPDCPVVTGRTDLSAVNPDKTKLEACRICTPLESQDDTTALAGR